MKIVILFLLFSILSCASVEEKKRSEEIRYTKNKIIDSCIERGGIPILSAWDGRLIDCKGLK